MRFFEEEGIERVTELSGRHFDRYKIWRRGNGDLNNATLTTRLSSVRAFSKWAESVDAVPKGTHEG